MEDISLLSAILGSGVVASLLTSAYSTWSADRAIRIQNVTQERKQWRDRLRQIVVGVNLAYSKGRWKSIRVLEAELTVRLNPEDTEDNRILEALGGVRREDDNREHHLKEFNELVASLLKHDWERAKIESGSQLSVAAAYVTILFLCSILMMVFTWFDLGDGLSFTTVRPSFWTLIVSGVAIRLFGVAVALAVLLYFVDGPIKWLANCGDAGYELAKLLGKVSHRAVRRPYERRSK